jgi:hypothetical protein
MLKFGSKHSKNNYLRQKKWYRTIAFIFYQKWTDPFKSQFAVVLLAYTRDDNSKGTQHVPGPLAKLCCFYSFPLPGSDFRLPPPTF